VNVLSVDDLKIRYGVETVFEGLEFGIDRGENVALVGPNGVGKTTLLQLVAGDERPDDGTISLAKEARVAFLRQKPAFDGAETAREVLRGAMRDVREAIEEFESISSQLSDADEAEEESELVERQHELQQRIERLGGWDWEHRVEGMLDRLGVDAWVDRPLEDLSGGQERRVAMARVLLAHPDLLMLDEPTNHLDPETVSWLEDWLIEFPGAVLFVTHDRYFLERVADRILELDARDGLFEHPPHYQTFMERKLERLEIRKRTKQRTQKLIEEELDWLDRGVKSQGRDTEKREDELEELAERAKSVDYDREKVEVEFHADQEFGVEILAARNIYKSYGELSVLEGANLTVVHGDKIGLLGPNGCGKTTLLEIMLGEEHPDSGRVEVGDKTREAYMTQEEADFDPDETVYEGFSASDYVWVGDTRHHKRDFLEKFLFDYEDQKKKISTLSGGQIRRLQLAKVVGEHANLIVLDEPTNDLDIASMQALEEALRSFEGCLIVVSHDRYFLNRVCNTIVAYESGDWNRYPGTYDDYRKAVGAREALEEESSEGGGGDGDGRPEGGDADPEPEVEEASTGLSYEEREELAEMEERIVGMEERREEIEAALNDPELYDERPGEIPELNAELREVEEKIEALYDRWEELEARRSG